MLVFEEKGNAELQEKNFSEQGRRGVDVGLEPRPHQSLTHCLLALWSAGKTRRGHPRQKVAATLMGYKSSQHFAIPDSVRYES